MEKGVDILKRKVIIIFLLVFTLINFTGCSMISKISHDEKPTNYYYTNGLLTFYKNEVPQSMVVFYADLYKEKTLDKANYVDMDNFLNSLKTENFVERPSNLPEVPLYKIYIEFEKIKYVLNVYNEKYVSIYPWDGKYDMDFVDMSTIPIAYNLYGVCKFHLPDK